MRALRPLAVLCLLLGCPSLPAGEAAFGGISLTPPDGWALEDRARVRSALARQSGPAGTGVDIDSVVAVWREAGAPPEAAGRMVFARRSSEIAVGTSGRWRARALLEQALRRDPSVEEFRLRSASVAEVDGAPAYRFRLRQRSQGREVESLLYVVGAAETHVLAFSSPASRYGELEPSFEKAVASVSLSRRQPQWRRASLWLWCGLLGGFLGSALAGRSRAGSPATARPARIGPVGPGLRSSA